MSPVDKVIGVEARGFIVAGAVAYRLGAGFVPVRKKGKLPWRVHSDTYELEYGVDTLEVHTDAVQRGGAGADPGRCTGDGRHSGGHPAAGARNWAATSSVGLRFGTGLPWWPPEPRRTGRGGACQLRVTEVGHNVKVARTVT